MIINKKYLEDNKINFYVIVYFTILFLCFAYIKSLDQSTEIIINNLKSINAVLLISIFLPLIWVVALPSRCLYLLGASPALGVFPEFNFAPFLKEFTHFVMLLTLCSLIIEKKLFASR
jgi:hypothetical protein